jgi:hypothetical protein
MAGVMDVTQKSLNHLYFVVSVITETYHHIRVVLA